MDNKADWTWKEIDRYGNEKYEYGYKSGTIVKDADVKGLLRELAEYLVEQNGMTSESDIPTIFSNYYKEYQEMLENDINNIINNNKGDK